MHQLPSIGKYVAGSRPGSSDLLPIPSQPPSIILYSALNSLLPASTSISFPVADFDTFLFAENDTLLFTVYTNQFGDMNYLFTDLTGIAMSVAGMGRYPKALRIIGVVNEAARKAKLMSLEDFPMHFWQELINKHIRGTREKLGEELTLKYESEGKAMDLDETIKYALDFEKD